MGSRGMSSGLNQRQISLEQIFLFQEVAQIKSEANALMEFGERFVGVGGGSVAVRRRFCACCGEFEMPIESEYEVCPICGWVDDVNQNNNPASLSGRNPICLNSAREAYYNGIKI